MVLNSGTYYAFARVSRHQYFIKVFPCKSLSLDLLSTSITSIKNNQAVVHGILPYAGSCISDFIVLHTLIGSIA